MVQEASTLRMILGASHRNLSKLTEFVASLDQSSRSHIRILNYLDMEREFGQIDWRGWIDDSGFCAPPFDIRSTYSTVRYPVALSHHTLSYPGQINKTFSQLVLSETYECDSFVCTSVAAKKMTEYYLERTSEHFKQHFNAEARFRGSLDVIPLGVDCDRFAPRSKGECRARLGLPKKGINILYFGRVSVVDKAELFPLVVAFRDAKKRNPLKSVKLIIAGREYRKYELLLRTQLNALKLGQLPSTESL